MWIRELRRINPYRILRCLLCLGFVAACASKPNPVVCPAGEPNPNATRECVAPLEESPGGELDSIALTSLGTVNGRGFSVETAFFWIEEAFSDQQVNFFVSNQAMVAPCNFNPRGEDLLASGQYVDLRFQLKNAGGSEFNLGTPQAPLLNLQVADTENREGGDWKLRNLAIRVGTLKVDSYTETSPIKLELVSLFLQGDDKIELDGVFLAARCQEMDLVYRVQAED